MKPNFILSQKPQLNLGVNGGFLAALKWAHCPAFPQRELEGQRGTVSTLVMMLRISLGVLIVEVIGRGCTNVGGY